MPYEPISPYLRVEAYPLGAISVCRGRGWALTDTVRSMMRGPGMPGLETTPDAMIPSTVNFGAVPARTTDTVLRGIRNLQYRELDDDVDGTGLAGFIIRPEWVPRNNYAESGGAVDDVCAPSEKYRAVGWRSLDGDQWRTCRADENDHTGIVWHNSQAGATFTAETTRALPKAQDFAVRLRTWAAAPNRQIIDPPRVTLGWGNSQYSVTVRPKSSPLLTRGPWTANGTVLREFPQDARGGWFEGEETWLYVEHLGGRQVVTVAGPAGYHQQVYSVRGVTADGEPREYLDPIEQKARSGAVRLSGQSCACTAELYEGLHAAYDPEAGDWSRVGEFEREYHAPISSIYSQGGISQGSDAGFGVKALVLGYPAWNKKGYGSGEPRPVGIEVANVTDAPVRGNRRKYTCQFQGEHQYAPAGPVGVDGDYHPPEPGIGPAATNPPPLTPVSSAEDNPWSRVAHNNWWQSATPLVHAVSLQYRSKYLAPASDAPIDLRPALKSASARTADPGISPARSFQASLSHHMIRRCPRLDTGEEVGDAWSSYVGRHHKVKVYAAWEDAAGHQFAYLPELGANVPEVLVMEGYTTLWSPELQGYERSNAQLHVTDPLMRLSKPAGVVDSRYAPLDFLLAEKVQAGLGNDLAGYECAHHVIQQTLGPTFLRYYPYPPNWGGILKTKMLTEPPQGGGFFFPPPFGQDALSWLRQIAEVDFAVLFYDRYLEDGTWHYVPHYGNYWQWLRNAATYSLQDSDASGFAWLPLEQIGAAEKGEADINRVVVWGMLPGAQDMRGLMPALPSMTGEARIEQSSVAGQGIAETWERTRVLEGSHFWYPGIASSVASWIISFINEVRMRSATWKTRGLPGANWGQRVTVQSATNPFRDSVTETAGSEFRVAQVQHQWEFGEQVSWTTTQTGTPLPNVAATYDATLQTRQGLQYCLDNGEPV